jgi:LacI family transcriptional regulator
MMRITLDYIAKEAGVSKATASNVLNNCGSVSKGKREEILALMAKHNFKPLLRRKKGNSRKAAGLKNSAIAIVLPHSAITPVGSRFHDIFISGVERVLSHFSCNLLITRPQEMDRSPAVIQTGGLDGVIVAWHNEIPPRLSIPMVGVLSPLYSLQHDVVLSDHESIGFAAAQQLHAAGCKRCAFVNPLVHHRGFAIRKRAFIEAAERCQTKVKAFETSYDGDPATISALIQAVLNDVEAPDGIFIPGSDPEVAAIALELQKQSGKPLAGLKVVGCVSDIGLLGPMNLGIDYIDIRLEDIGAAAASTLLWRIENPTAANRRVMIQPSVTRGEG